MQISLKVFRGVDGVKNVERMNVLIYIIYVNIYIYMIYMYKRNQKSRSKLKRTRIRDFESTLEVVNDKGNS